MYGPFTRSGAPARTENRPGEEGWAMADAIDPSGRKRAAALLVHDGNDGDQSAATLYPARRGAGLAREGKRLREGNAVAFGDFDGDGDRDVAIGDDGSRNDEPGYETEEPEVDGSLSVHPGNGSTPRTYRIPGSENGDYGPGGYSAADPDGDGRDAIVVSTDDGALLIDIGPAGGSGDDASAERRVTVSRTVPARVDGRKVGQRARAARPFGAADFDGDGRDELVLCWGADGSSTSTANVPPTGGSPRAPPPAPPPATWSPSAPCPTPPEAEGGKAERREGREDLAKVGQRLATRPGQRRDMAESG